MSINTSFRQWLYHVATAGPAHSFTCYVTSWKIWGSNAGNEKLLYLLEIVQTGFGAHPASYLMAKTGLFIRK
jgi:hypothetical protein